LLCAVRQCLSCGADAQPDRRRLAAVYVDFFKGGETRTPKYAPTSNEMAKCRCWCTAQEARPIGVILTYLAERAGKFKPEGEDERLEALRWIIFDNQKGQWLPRPYRFLKNFASHGRSGVMAFLEDPHRRNLAIVDKRWPPAVHSRRAADHRRRLALRLSLLSAEEFASNRRHPQQHRGLARSHQGAPGWKHPYELMPGYPPQL